jgi:hypothetical protein
MNARTNPRKMKPPPLKKLSRESTTISIPEVLVVLGEYFRRNPNSTIPTPRRAPKTPSARTVEDKPGTTLSRRERSVIAAMASAAP